MCRGYPCSSSSAIIFHAAYPGGVHAVQRGATDMLFWRMDVVGGSRFVLSIIDALSHLPRCPVGAEVHVGTACRAENWKLCAWCMRNKRGSRLSAYGQFSSVILAVGSLIIHYRAVTLSLGGLASLGDDNYVCIYAPSVLSTSPDSSHFSLPCFAQRSLPVRIRILCSKVHMWDDRHRYVF